MNSELTTGFYKFLLSVIATCCVVTSVVGLVTVYQVANLTRALIADQLEAKEVRLSLLTAANREADSVETYIRETKKLSGLICTYLIKVNRAHKPCPED